MSLQYGPWHRPWSRSHTLRLVSAHVSLSCLRFGILILPKLCCTIPDRTRPNPTVPYASALFRTLPDLTGLCPCGQYTAGRLERPCLPAPCVHAIPSLTGPHPTRPSPTLQCRSRLHRATRHGTARHRTAFIAREGYSPNSTLTTSKRPMPMLRPLPIPTSRPASISTDSISLRLTMVLSHRMWNVACQPAAAAKR